MEMEAATSTRESASARLLPERKCTSGSCYLYSLVAVASIGGLLFGYDTGVVSGAMALIRRAWGLNDVEHEAIVSSTTGLAAVGAMVSGAANRAFGRRPVLLGSAVVFTLGAAMMGLARNFVDLLIGRCIVGFAVGLASSTVPLYIAELAPPELRGRLVSVNNSCIVIGQVVATIVDGLLASDRVNGWRWMLGLGGVPSIIQFGGLLLLPESPRWLLSRGRTSEARATLTKLRSAAPDVNSAVDSEIEEILATLAIEGVGRRGAQAATAASNGAAANGADAARPGADAVDGPRAGVGVGGAADTVGVKTGHAGAGGDGRSAPPEGSSAAPTVPTAAIGSEGGGGGGGGGGVSLHELWQVRRQLTLGVGLLTLQQLIGINTIMYYSVSILIQANVGTVSQSIWLAVPVAASQLVGCLVGGWLIDRTGRRTLVLLSLFGVVLSLALEGGAFALDAWVCATNTTNAADAADGAASVGGGGGGVVATVCSLKSTVTVLSMVLYLLCFGVGMSPVPWAINAEIYPMHVRTTCMGIATAANWITNFVVSASFFTLQDLVSKPGAFWLYGSIALVGGIWLALVMPETAGRSLEQIDMLFRDSGVVHPTRRSE